MVQNDRDNVVQNDEKFLVRDGKKLLNDDGETAGRRVAINRWAMDDRPREKLERLGAEALSNAELLAILIGSGTPRESAVDLMKRLMADCGNDLDVLARKGVRELVREYAGIGPAKAITILAAVELGRRRQSKSAEERPLVRSSREVYELMFPLMRDLPTEEMWLLLRNGAGRLIRRVRISSGGLTETVADVRLIVKEAILSNATSIILCHNHPSGNPRPSRQDDILTERLRSACETMQIMLCDHCIITDGGVYSYNDEGKI